MANKKKLKEILKSDFYGTGTPIYKSACSSCYFCRLPNKKNRFPVCKNPSVYNARFISRSMVIECPDEEKDCVYYRWMVKHKKDILLIKKYIIKYWVDGYIAMSKKHFNWLMDKIKINEIGYLLGLFEYYGYIRITDKKVDKPYLLTNKDFWS